MSTTATAATGRPVLAILDDVERLADLQARIKDLTAEADSIKARLRDDYRDTPGVHDLGAHKVTVTPTARFSEDQARAVLPAELVALCTVTALSGATFKQLVPPPLYAACCTPPEPRVAVS